MKGLQIKKSALTESAIQNKQQLAETYEKKKIEIKKDYGKIRKGREKGKNKNIVSEWRYLVKSLRK